MLANLPRRLPANPVAAFICRASIAVGAALLAAVPAQAATYFQSLSFFTPSALANGVIGYQFDNGGGRSNSYYVPATGDGPSTITDPFAKTQTALQIFFLGVSTEDTASDQLSLLAADPVQHLVLATNTLYSASLTGLAFGDVFTGFNEAELIEALDILGDGGLAEGDDGYEAQLQAASTRLFQFQDVLFAANAGFGSQDAFGLTSFSIGTPAGTGFASTTIAAVPEPATWVTMMLGFGLVGAALRRREARIARA